MGGKSAVASSEVLWVSLLMQICKSFSNAEDLLYQFEMYLEKHQTLSSSQKFINFLSEQIIAKLSEKKLVVFIDEIQSLYSWNLQEEFLVCVRAIADNVLSDIFNKISFVLLGVSKPSDFNLGRETTLNLGSKIELEYLEENCTSLKKGLANITNDCDKVFNRIYFWTNGQPFLTQYLCYLTILNSEVIPEENYSFYVDSIIRRNLLDYWRSLDPQSHFQEIENNFLKCGESIQIALRMLSCYEVVLQEHLVNWGYDNESHMNLLISGLVVKKNEDYVTLLKVANSIYKHIFNLKWICETRRKLIADRIPVLRFVKNINQLSNDSWSKDCWDILKSSLYPFVELCMIEVLGLRWKESPDTDNILSGKINLNDLTCQHLLEILANDHFWHDVFDVVGLEPQVKGWSLGLLRIYSHNKFDNDADISLMLNYIRSLLIAVGADSEAKLIEQLMTNKTNQMTNKTKQMVNSDYCPDQLPLISSKQLSEFPDYSETKISFAIAKSSFTAAEDANYSNPINEVYEMSREQRIESIIEKRKPQAEKVRRAKKALSILQGILDEVESCREKTLQRAEDPSIRDKLLDLRFSSERDKIRQCLDILSRLESRFSRDTLAIAFVGRAGQGKSRLIQSITGLTKSEVPDGTGGNCTGVKCTVCNEITDEPYGEVYFYSKQSFLQEVIYPYYDFLHLGEKPTSLSSFTTNPLPKIIEGAGAEALSYYAFLVKCHDNYSSFESLLEENSPKRISRGEIREYVAQTREDNQSKYFNYLAVREVKIFCHFPNEDIGEIALIDLPGLGDTVLGDKDKVRSSLGHDVDFAIFVARPHTRTFQEEDYRLYDIANDALTELPIAKWSAVTLNNLHSAGQKSNIIFKQCVKEAVKCHQKVR
jgi:hypothetical protein